MKDICSKNGWRLAFQYRTSRRHDLGRPNQRWKDQENFQDKEEQALMDLTNLTVPDDYNDNRDQEYEAKLVHNTTLLELSSSETHSATRAN